MRRGYLMIVTEQMDIDVLSCPRELYKSGICL